MKKFPVICPLGARVKITQGFRPSNNPSHDSVDFQVWDDSLSERENKRLSFGSQFVLPVDATCTNVNDFGTMNPLGNGIDFEWQEDGFYYTLHFWHTVYNNYNKGDRVKAGSIVALMGNTGFVFEDGVKMPTAENPYGGVHCHLRFSRYQKDPWGIGNINIVSLDPTLYFDVLDPYRGEDSSIMVDVIPLQWAFDKLGFTSVLEKLIYYFKYIATWKK